MNVLTLTGYFGSGKSSFVLRAARYYTRELGLRIAVLQNEISENGVDDALLRSDGLVVSELVGGCICCKLSNELIVTIRKIERDLHPDILIIEASGMATPRLLRFLLGESDLTFGWIRQLAILDASRYQRLKRLFDLPLLREAVESADICLLNKIDLSVEDAKERFHVEAQAVNPDCMLFETVLSSSDQLPDAVQAVVTPCSSHEKAHPVGGMKPQHGHQGRHPEVFSGQCITPPVELTAETVCARMKQYADRLNLAGCSQVAHIKLFLETREPGGVMISITDLERSPTFATPPPRTFHVVKATVNAIVYDVDQNNLADLSETLLKGLCNE